MTYAAPVDELKFALTTHAPMEELGTFAAYRDLDKDTIAAIIEAAAEFAGGDWATANQLGDRAGVKLEGGKVLNDPATSKAYSDFVAAGWGSLKAPEEFGGQNLPTVVGAVCNEMWYGGNVALSLLPLLAEGAVTALHAHASPKLKEKFLPHLIDGTWAATMNISEPAAGSDLAPIATLAKPLPDGTYALSGQKIFITWGEHELAENIIHLVLARLPDAPQGTRGLSLFLVPKFWVEDDGTLGAKNGIELVSLEHKLGLHASPTCTLEFNAAKGYLVGEPNRGLAHMFTMMNHARLGVGIEGLALAEAAVQKAERYARERIQGKDSREPKAAPVSIIHHPDVKRMLLTQKATIDAGRALYLTTAYYLDVAEHHPDSGKKAEADALVNFLIPLVKGWLSEKSVVLTNLALQVFGGAGYVEETGIAQLVRDARITPIYEGTTGIQALDSVGRKTAKDKGVTAFKLLDLGVKLSTDLRAAGAPHLADLLTEALELARKAVAYVVKNAGGPRRQEVEAGSVAYLMQMGATLSAVFLVRAYLSAREAIQDESKRVFSPAFYQKQLNNVAIFYTAVLPEVYAYYRQLIGGAIIAALPENMI